jgi:hypothetical protein
MQNSHKKDCCLCVSARSTLACCLDRSEVNYPVFYRFAGACNFFPKMTMTMFFIAYNERTHQVAAAPGEF